jgi:hypothetical protein
MGDGTDCDALPCSAFCNGACCRNDGSCFETSPAYCDAVYGMFQGLGTDCDPNPCTTPTEKTSWGTIKQMYRGR